MAASEHWTCDRLESGLVFFRGRIDACCVSHHGDRGHAVLVESYHGGKFPLEHVRDGRRRLIDRLQRPGGHPACMGCVKLVKRAPRRPKYLIDDLILSPHTHCNLRCRYCDLVLPDFRHVHAPSNMLPVIKELVQGKLLSRRCLVGWSGGEPTLLQEFDETYTLLARMGARQIVATNALILSETLLKRIPESLYVMYVSVDAGSRETYQLLKGRDAFDQVWDHLEAYIRVGRRRVIPKMILMRENLHEVAQFVERSHKAGAWSVICDVNSKEEHLDEATVLAAATMLQECAKRGIRLTIGYQTRHYWPEKRFDARVKLCYGDAFRKLPFMQRVLQRIGTAKALRHALRIATAHVSVHRAQGGSAPGERLRKPHENSASEHL